MHKLEEIQADGLLAQDKAGLGLCGIEEDREPVGRGRDRGRRQLDELTGRTGLCVHVDRLLKAIDEAARHR